MADHTDILVRISEALASRTATAKNSVAAVRLAEGWYLTATLWGPEVLVASEQSLPRRDEFEAVVPGGAIVHVSSVGRDPATNIAVLKLSEALAAPPIVSGKAQTAGLVLAIGADGEGGARARLGVVNSVGGEWRSSRGGRIDQRLLLDVRLSHREEGGPVFDAEGGLLGISTFGPRGRVLVIPTPTVERIVPVLLEHGRTARGWLGLALQPVAIPDALREQAGQFTGLMVMSIVEDGPAAKAGLVGGDIILSVDGTSTQRVRSLAGRLDPESIGKDVDIRLIRGGGIISVRAVISERPSA
jgi:S1-C subfamily serine protease